jgi:hypothetical protein
MAFHPKKTILALVAAAGLFAVPADAAFSNADLNDFVDLVNAQELDAAQTKAVAKINALEAKEYASFSKELGGASAVAKAAAKPFAGNSEVTAALTELATTEGDGDSLFFQMNFGDTGFAGAMVIAADLYGGNVKKYAAIVGAKLTRPLAKVTAATDPAKRLKFMSKVAKGAEWFHNKAAD